MTNKGYNSIAAADTAQTPQSLRDWLNEMIARGWNSGLAVVVLQLLKHRHIRVHENTRCGRVFTVSRDAREEIERFIPKPDDPTKAALLRLCAEQHACFRAGVLQGAKDVVFECLDWLLGRPGYVAYSRARATGSTQLLRGRSDPRTAIQPCSAPAAMRMPVNPAQRSRQASIAREAA